jgi:general secretion pathway protein K
MKRRNQAGAALLMAMLTVTLVATFAAAAMWQQWRSIEVEQAERTRVQSAWILTGALDWARLILREDGRAGGPDYLSEPWAVPLQEARLSTFLAAEKGVATNVPGDSDTLDAFLSGQIIDLQSLLNVNDLVDGGRISDSGLRAFRRLFELLGLPAEQLGTFAENLRFASDTSADNRSGPLAPLMPQRVEQLVWLGLSPGTVSALQPFVTVLPTRTPVNLNTAKAEVIYAVLDGISMADAQRLVLERTRSHFRDTADVRRLVPALEEGTVAPDRVGIASSYFESRGRLRFGKMIVEERSVLQRAGFEVRALQRERGVIEAPAPGATLPDR